MPDDVKRVTAGASEPHPDRTRSPASTIRAVPRLALTHGQTLGLLTELGLDEGTSRKTFNSYLKSLRRLGIPFGEKQGASRVRGPDVHYGFEDLMELVLALLLRVYGTLPDSVAAGLRECRADLRPIYRLAYADAVTRTFRPALISEKGGRHTAAEGLFLDLNIRFAAGQLVEFGPPRAIPPFDAVTTFVEADVPARAYMPLNLTAIAKTIMSRMRAR